jgi:hypothetical protein
MLPLSVYLPIGVVAILKRAKKGDFLLQVNLVVSFNMLTIVIGFIMAIVLDHDKFHHEKTEFINM